MRNLLDDELNQYRVPFSDMQLLLNPGVKQDAWNGNFLLPVLGKKEIAEQLGHKADKPYVYLRIIAASGGGWDHVSISAENPDGSLRTPRWGEMEFVKRLFFKEDEVAMQLHVTPKDHINLNPYVLHLWRPHKQRIPLPPKSYV